jgi:hypothetical protein
MNRVTAILSPRTYPGALLVALTTLLTILLAGASCRREVVTHARVAKGSEAMPSTDPPPGMGRLPLGAPPASGQAPTAESEVALPPQPGQGEKLAWALPKGWTETKGSGMRYATLQPSVQGKTEVSIVMLSGAVGGELANVNRWRGQIGLLPVDEAELPKLRSLVTSKAGPVALYDFTSEGQVKTRMVVGTLATGVSTWFLKLNGDADAVSSARADFVTYLGTLHLE